MVFALGVWLVASPWVLRISGDGNSTQNTILNGGALIWAALWALMSRWPMPAHVTIVAVGAWLLLAPWLWTFGERAAIWNSAAIGLAAVVLSASVLYTGPWTRPPLDAAGHGARGMPGTGGRSP